MCTTHHSVCLTNGEYTPGFFLPFDVTRIGPEVDVTGYGRGPGYFALQDTETPVQPARFSSIRRSTIGVLTVSDNELTALPN